jgi:hypothetical protein
MVQAVRHNHERAASEKFESERFCAEKRVIT